jgi:uracil phosphoribosyltransferase
MSLNLHVLNHPLSKHCLAYLRDRTTQPATFRILTHKVTTLLAIEATRELRTGTRTIETPLETTEGEVLDEPLVVVPILRAGLGMLEAIVQLFPDVGVGYIGLERDESTAIATSYYRKLPDVRGKAVMLVDPMLATGGSACMALADILKGEPAQMIYLCIVAAPEGVAWVNEQFPQVRIFAAALDRELNAQKYILPGLGDFGDRLYGTT